MKKTILALFTFMALSITLSAQRMANLKVKFTSPENHAYIPSKKTFTFSAVIYNMDTVHVTKDDTLRFYLLINNDSMFFVEAGTGRFINHLNLANRIIDPGDSIVFSNIMAFDPSYDNLTINMCAFVKPFNLARPISDPDLTDNRGCSVIHVREKNSGIQSTGSAHHLVRIFPNPASGDFHISSSEMIRTVQLTDIAGRIIGMNFSDSGVVDCSQLASGPYILSVTTENGIYTSRISIQN